ncbi:hypothetical protein AAU61_13800 [Desulfocarbo indianensis]|nr:hypothetical protein AAU61_13800 [Desulfocarbo indianensis]
MQARRKQILARSWAYPLIAALLYSGGLGPLLHPCLHHHGHHLQQAQPSAAHTAWSRPFIHHARPCSFCAFAAYLIADRWPGPVLGANQPEPRPGLPWLSSLSAQARRHLIPCPRPPPVL